MTKNKITQKLINEIAQQLTTNSIFTKEYIKETYNIEDENELDKIYYKYKYLLFATSADLVGYERNISDKLALGYGSKYQLLRMLGWHRHEFNKSLASLLNTSDNINWFDFKFNLSNHQKKNGEKELVYDDKELLNVEFMPEEIKEDLYDKWYEVWPCTKMSGLNWDAVGIDENGTYILVEAKANIKELDSNCQAMPQTKSMEKIDKAIKDLQEKYNIVAPIEIWKKPNYQFANRLVFLDFLKSQGFKAKFVYVFFINGFITNALPPKLDEPKEKWEDKLNEELIQMGIKGTSLEKEVNVLYFDCNRKE